MYKQGFIHTIKKCLGVSLLNQNYIEVLFIFIFLVNVLRYTCYSIDIIMYSNIGGHVVSAILFCSKT